MSAQSTHTARPNILLITSDQQHFDTLGVANPRIQTPHLDRLCREGTRFTRAYCPNPTCTPTRATLLTGLMPSHHGAWSLGTKLREDLPTLPGVLSDAGYFSALIGKAHFQPLKSTPAYPSIECQPTLRDLDFWRNFHGPWYGFDHFELARNHADEGHVGAHYAIWMEEQGLLNWTDYFQRPDGKSDPALRRTYTHDNDPRKWDLPAGCHYSTWTAERSMAAIDRAQSEDRPFFVWASFLDPHPPYVVPEPWASMYDPADMEPGRMSPGEHERNPATHRHAAVEADPDFWRDRVDGQGSIHGAGFQGDYPEEELRRDIACYYGMVSFMDEQIGRLLARLDELGLAENTLVVFTTDHGHFLGQHGIREKAIHHYEDLLKLPFVARWPARIPAGTVSPHLQNLVDLPRTFLQAAGVPTPVSWQGVDQLPAWLGGAAARQWSITENHHGYTRFHMHSFVTDRHKLTVHRDSLEGELFDLVADPGEIHNLWDDPASQSLKKDLLHAFLRATMEQEPIAMPRIARA